MSSSSPSEQIRKQGYLKRKGKRRYIVQENLNLSWFLAPLVWLIFSTVVIIVNVTGWVTRNCEFTKLRNIWVGYLPKFVFFRGWTTILLTENGFTLVSTIGGENHPFEGKNAQENKEWIYSLKSAKRTHREKMNDVFSVTSFQSSPPKMGWLEKKGKRRWFVLHENILYWFNNEQVINRYLTSLKFNSGRAPPLTFGKTRNIMVV